MCDPRKPYIDFCCMGHETYFTEDFLSDEDDQFFTFDLHSQFNISFMPEPYEDLTFEISKNHFHEEVGVQCETKNPALLSKLSSMPAYSRSLKDKVIIPNSVNFHMKHTARVFIPIKVEEAFKCKHCFQAFKSGQALGGHMSRKH